MDQLVLSLFAVVALAYSQQYAIQSPFFVQQGYDSRYLEPTLGGVYGGPSLADIGYGYGGGWGGYGGYYKK